MCRSRCMNILIFYPEVQKLKLVSFYLESQLGIHVEQASTLEAAMSHLLSEKSVDLIVTSQSEQELMLFKYLLSTGAKIPVILIENDNYSPSSHQLFGEIPILAHIKESEAAAKLLSVVKENYAELMIPTSIDGDYCRINVELLLRVVPLEGDVFVRLSSVKFVKIYHGRVVFSQTDLDKIWGVKKIDYLYIRKENASDFISRLQKDITMQSEAASEGEENLLVNVGHAHETVHDLAQKIGFTPEIMELTKSYVQLAITAIGKTPKLDSFLFSNLLKNKNYISNHSILLAHIACSLAAKMEWPSDSTFQKLILAGFLHDITLSNPNHAKIHTKAAMSDMKNKISEADLLLIRNHPFAAGDLLNKLSEIPGDVFSIISQHHEQPDGSGFPRGLVATQIAPLAAVFIVAHELVDLYIDSGSEFDFNKFDQEHLQKYTGGTFKKIAKALSGKISDSAA
jgi:hypothetical protein